MTTTFKLGEGLVFEVLRKRGSPQCALLCLHDVHMRSLRAHTPMHCVEFFFYLFFLTSFFSPVESGLKEGVGEGLVCA